MAETGELRSKMEKVQLDMIDMVSKYPRPIEISGRWKVIQFLFYFILFHFLFFYFFNKDNLG